MNEQNQAPDFVIDPSATIKWPVTVSLPVDGGAVAEFRFIGEFKRLSETELDKLLVADQIKHTALSPLPLQGEGRDGDGVPAAAEPEPKRMAQILEENAALFPQLLVGWEGVKTATGDDAPFSAKSLQSQITGPNGVFISTGLWLAVHQIRRGEARLGN